jgi:hypothetical protein
MPLTFIRVDGVLGGWNIWYRDEFGQPRFLEVSVGLGKEFVGKELIRQVNELLARPRPSESLGSVVATRVADCRRKGLIGG